MNQATTILTCSESFLHRQRGYLIAKLRRMQ